MRKLAAMGCSNREIACFYSIDESQIRRRFAAIIEEGRENGKTHLRSLIWRSAETHYAVQIFLAKNILGYSDNVRVKQTHKGMLHVSDTELGKLTEAELAQHYKDSFEEVDDE